jgi:hypothetical protein
LKLSWVKLSLTQNIAQDIEHCKHTWAWTGGGGRGGIG